MHYQKTTLDNGLRLITSTIPHTRSVAICFFIGAGSRYETDAQGGICHFIEHLHFKGTARRLTSNDICSAIEGVGGILNAGTDKEMTIYWAKVAQPHFAMALDVLVDMLLNARFDAEDIEKERMVIIEELHMSEDSPPQKVNLLIDQLLWPGHPLGRDIAGNQASVTAITREMILDFHASQYLPGNTVLSIAGNISHEAVVAEVSRVIGDWQNRATHPGYAAYQDKHNPRLRVETRDTEQTHLCLALPGVPLLHPWRFHLDLLNVILGEGMSSRLFTEIRDKLGLAYSIHSYIDHYLDCGAITVQAGTEPKKLPVAIEAILKQLALLKEPIPEAELAKAKESTKGRLLLRMEDTRSVAGWAGSQEIITGNILTVDDVVATIEAITADQLSEVARELLVSDCLRLAVVGPAAKKGESLEQLLKL